MPRALPRPLVAGNWKMNGLKAARRELDGMVRGLAKGGRPACDVFVCPPATLIARLAEAARGSPIKIGGQDCHARPSGAHTGDVAAEMLADAGAKAVIVGHSERRHDHGETDAIVAGKVEAAWRAGLVAIVCVGETEAERDRGEAEAVVARSLAGSLPAGVEARNTVVAYEPVWAIGTGRTPTTDEIEAMHGLIRARLTARFGPGADGVRLLYGGSVKPDNAAAILALKDVNGALVGGASLKADSFLAILGVYARKPSLKKSAPKARR